MSSGDERKSELRPILASTMHASTYTTNGHEYGYDSSGKRFCRGAMIGRIISEPTAPATTDKPRFYLRRVKMCGAYDQGGAYWGVGIPLYEYESSDFGDDVVSGFLRAESRLHAKHQLVHKYPGATFYR